ncbi:AmpG family muropeptide MFS transporter [Polymorphobacter fuscus]|uniref:MFS transporter n=1 Tax=Sandarakinorhabdus fusca TaxID=1439888 RepID=A0A7C9GR02_9SPHN|nr:MFS transporter [Polymorphobacter fuscus]KAB7645619.1 AmpG family muropeptide MFS transporter [Polymorphobacter fuscus]MQT18070.1 MFS transporter [Polymorphobacter fuscus]NJC08703.1 PAT family beta-lactamase induction signal transducer AmpG [Polymorphobacter fuscus]
MTDAVSPDWRAPLRRGLAGLRHLLPPAVRPYFEPGPLGALALGISSGFPFAMIASTLSTRLAEAGIDKKAVTAFALAFLLYNFKFLWAPVIDRVRLPLLADRIGQRRAWLLVIGLCVMASVAWLGLADPQAGLGMVVAATLTVAFFGATYDIVIDAFRIENLSQEQLGVGSGMSQYGWRIGSSAAGAIVLLLAESRGWSFAYVAATLFALPAIIAGLLLGEPRRPPAPGALLTGWAAVQDAVIAPLADFLRRDGAVLALLFILFHKIGDTMANLTFRLLFNDLGFTKPEIAFYDVQLGLVAYLVGVFVGGIVFTRLGMKAAVLLSLVLMAVSNLSFAALAAAGHSNFGMAAAIGFENFTSGIGGVAVVAYLSALCDLRFTATQFALLSAASSIAGRFVTGTTSGALVETMGFVNFYLLTTLLALPGILIFVYMMRSGLVDDAIPDRPASSA